MAKKKTETDPKLPQRKLEIVPGSSVPVLYVNNVNIDLSSLDVRLRLGQIQGATDTALQVKEIAHIYMSHPHFRALATAVQTIIEKMKQFPSPEQSLGEDSKTSKPH